jgi:hypothetical protein
MGRPLSSTHRPPHNGKRELPDRRRDAYRAVANVMSDVETNSLVKLDRLLVSEPQPKYIMQPEASAIPVTIPGVKQSRDFYPVKRQVGVWMIAKETLDSFPVMGMRHNANLVTARKLPRPVPREAGLCALSRTTRVTDDQNSHKLRSP